MGEEGEPAAEEFDDDDSAEHDSGDRGEEESEMQVESEARVEAEARQGHRWRMESGGTLSREK
jgi:hypothetical protein